LSLCRGAQAGNVAEQRSRAVRGCTIGAAARRSRQRAAAATVFATRQEEGAETDACDRKRAQFFQSVSYASGLQYLSRLGQQMTALAESHAPGLFRAGRGAIKQARQAVKRAKLGLRALEARFKRSRSRATFIAVTGSSSKTTTVSL